MLSSKLNSVLNCPVTGTLSGVCAALAVLSFSGCTLNVTVPAAIATTTVATPTAASSSATPAKAPAAAPAPSAAPVATVATPAVRPAPSATGGRTAVTTTSWSEEFSAPDTSSFLGATYAALPSDASKSLYATTAGSVKLADGVLTLSNARFTIGALGNASTSAGTPGGVFSMVGKSCTMTLSVRSVSGTGNFYIYVDNNTTSQDSSPHGKASRVVNVATNSLIEGSNVFKWSLSKSSYTGESFLQIRADSNSTVVIDSANLLCN